MLKLIKDFATIKIKYALLAFACIVAFLLIAPAMLKAQEVRPLLEMDIPEGYVCQISAANNPSVHVGNVLLVSSGSTDVFIEGVEDVANGRVSGEIVSNGTISISMILGPDGETSLEPEIVCVPPKPPETTSTTVTPEVIITTTVPETTVPETTTVQPETTTIMPSTTIVPEPELALTGSNWTVMAFIIAVSAILAGLAGMAVSLSNRESTGSGDRPGS